MLNIVLYQPEIPQNTGNIMRTCAGTGSILHLIEPLGFKLDQKALRRSNLDYYEHVNYHVYSDWETFAKANPGVYIYCTRYGDKAPDAFDFSDQTIAYFLVFGRESTGLPKSLLRANRDRLLRLPMTCKIRSLNLANSVAVILYEALRQQGYPGLEKEEPMNFKGPNWIDCE